MCRSALSPQRMLTALAYFLTAALCLWLASRYVTRLDRAVALVLLLLPLCLTGRALLTGNVYAPADVAYASLPLSALNPDLGKHANYAMSDQARLMMPWRAAVRYALSQGEWPLRNPFIFCGDILAPASEPAPYHPLNLISYLLPLGPSLTFIAAMQYFLAALSMWLLLRELSVSSIAACVGAAAFAFCFMNVFYVGTPLALCAALLPLIFVGARRVVTRSDVATTLLLAITFTLALLAGHPETALKVITLGAVYSLVLLFRREHRGRFVPALRSGVAAGALALALSAIHLLPFIAALPETVEYKFRKSYYTNAERSVSAESLARRLPAHIVPFRFGIPGQEQSRAVDAQQIVHIGYTVSALFALALLGLWRGSAADRWFFSAASLFGVLAGTRAPGVSEALASVPLFAIALNERFVLAACVGVPLLAAMGIDAMVNARRHRVALLHVFVATAVGLTVLALSGSMRAEGLSASFISWHAAVEIGAVLAAGLIAWAANARWRPILLLTLVSLQSAAEFGSFCPTMDRSAFYPQVAALESLPDRQQRPYRVAGVEYELVPNTGAHYELEDPRGNHGMTNNRLYETYRLWSQHQPIWFNRIDDLSRPFLSFLNLRYALVSPGYATPKGWRIHYSDSSMTLLENERVLERAFIPSEVRVGLSRRDALYEMIHSEDPLRHVWIEVKRRGVEGAESLANGAGSVSIRNEGLGYRLQAKIDRAAWVVVSETFWNGWRAIDGTRELRLFPANHAFMAMRLEPGSHDVRMFFRPVSFEYGRAISFCTLALLLMWGSLVVIRRRSALKV